MKTEIENCDGAGPHAGQVRVYPLPPNGNLFLCRKCWDRENAYQTQLFKDRLNQWETAKSYEEHMNYEDTKEAQS